MTTGQARLPGVSVEVQDLARRFTRSGSQREAGSRVGPSWKAEAAHLLEPASHPS